MKLEMIPRITADGLDVNSFNPDLRLLFTPFAHHREEGRGFSAVIEWQREGDKLRPYLVVAIGSHVFQSGWLFG
jgi:hypothetical protein